LIRPEWTGENFAKLSLQIATGQPTNSYAGRRTGFVAAVQ